MAPDTQQRRRRMTAEDRHEQILDITHAIVDAEGFHAATLNRIAAEAGVSRTVLYQQFGDLPGLFVALVDREAARAGTWFAEAVAQSPPPTDRDGAFTHAFAEVLRAVDAHPATWRLFLFPPQGAPPELHARLVQAQSFVREYFMSVLLSINPDLPDPEYTAHILNAAGDELLRLRLTEPDAATHERLLAHVRRLTPALLRQAV
ncbi:TetR/AcrR family transcriptional regulator [Svornostia abyssi]|uniref:TetR/AcrR family transcriptional regulator n=2 Tax=Svornostia abyssi TaxID=2898438 RepID=A0ABY5PBX4_9ACTN|nr:TetR/AcrR family transcriptional regulator [Parviterribacteraceae bacterium J379]